MTWISKIIASFLASLAASFAGWLLERARYAAEKSKDEKASEKVREIVENAHTREERIKASRRNAANTP